MLMIKPLSKPRWLLLLRTAIILFISLPAFAQERLVTGTIKSGDSTF